MFAHQVIEDLRIYIKLCDDDEIKNYCNGLIPIIQKSQHFHIGDYDDLYTVYKPFIGTGLFTGQNKVKMPYKSMWIDWTNKTFKPDISKGETESPKEAILVYSLSENIICYLCFSYFKEQELWVPFFITFFTQIGETLDNNEEKFMKYLTGMDKFFIGCSTSICVKKYKAHKDRIIKEITYNITMLNITLKLLNCKNIQSEIIKAPEALNKKRRKTGKQEIFNYHVLNVVVPGKKRGYSPAKEPLSHNRLHLCRGHFKEYTTDHPLFGHYTGLYWWQPQVRGQNKYGMVIKDYNIQGASAAVK